MNNRVLYLLKQSLLLAGVGKAEWGGGGGNYGEEKYSSSRWMGLGMNRAARERVRFAIFFIIKKKKTIKPITQNTARADEEEIPQPTPVVKAAQ